MPNRLENLVVEEVSGVDKGANLREFIIRKGNDIKEPFRKLLKNLAQTIRKDYHDDEGAMSFAEALAESEKVARENEVYDALWPLWSPLRESISSVLVDDSVTDKRAAVAESLNQYLNKLSDIGLFSTEQAVKALENFNSRVEKDFNQESVLKQARSLLESLITKEEKPMPELAANDGTATKAAVDDLRKQFEDIQKSLDEVRKAKETAEAANVELNKRLESAETIAKAEQASRLQKEAENFIEKELPNIPGDRAELGGIVKSLRNGEPLAAENVLKLETALKAANEAIGKGKLFEEAGTGRQTNGNSGGIVEKVNKAADDLKKENANLSTADALSAVFRNNPAWYNEYSRKASIRVGSASTEE